MLVKSIHEFSIYTLNKLFVYDNGILAMEAQIELQY